MQNQLIGPISSVQLVEHVKHIHENHEEGISVCVFIANGLIRFSHDIGYGLLCGEEESGIHYVFDTGCDGEEFPYTIEEWTTEIYPDANWYLHFYNVGSAEQCSEWTKHYIELSEAHKENLKLEGN